MIRRSVLDRTGELRFPGHIDAVVTDRYCHFSTASSAAQHNRCGCLYAVFRRSRPPGLALRAFSSVGRAPRLHRGCHRFEPGRAHPLKSQGFCGSRRPRSGAKTHDFPARVPPVYPATEKAEFNRATAAVSASDPSQ